MALPIAFIESMKHVLPAAELESFLQALSEGKQPTSIRLNPGKKLSYQAFSFSVNNPIPWNEHGLYLSSRPQFTLDPLLHAGAYYVQEASSQFVGHVVRHILSIDENLSKRSVYALDLCASPGGKSTATIAELPTGSVLVSNEIDRKRARILAETIQKWGNPNVCVTANAPADFKRLRETFDIIIADVPCSGEGMFRKDAGAINEWNPAKVRDCAALQKQIVSEIWGTLRPGGYMIYSTCTFNIHENEENVQYIHDVLGGEIIRIPRDKSWNIHPALTGSFAPAILPESACRFMPHYTLGEGLFMALIRKPIVHLRCDNTEKSSSMLHSSNFKGRSNVTKNIMPDLSSWIKINATIMQNNEGCFGAISETLLPLYLAIKQTNLHLLSAGIELGELKGKDTLPAHALALSTALNRDAFPTVELDHETALNYLRREAIVLSSEVPRGFVLLTYQSLPLGFVKNIGNRCNSLYPMEWRIRNL